MIGYFAIPLFWYFGILSYEYLIGYAAIVFGLGTLASIASLNVAEFQLRPYPNVTDHAKLGSAAVLENFGYRQLHNLWRVWGWWQYLTAQHVWGEMPRVGFAGQRQLLASRSAPEWCALQSRAKWSPGPISLIRGISGETRHPPRPTRYRKAADLPTHM